MSKPYTCTKCSKLMYYNDNEGGRCDDCCVVDIEQEIDNKIETNRILIEMGIFTKGGTINND